MSSSPAIENFVTRNELELFIESIRRELSGYAKTNAEIKGELNSKLDQILLTKTEDARLMGGLQEQVRQLAGTVAGQAGEIAEIRRSQADNATAPKDAAIKFVIDVIKLALAAGFGYLVSRGGH